MGVLILVIRDNYWQAYIQKNFHCNFHENIHSPHCKYLHSHNEVKPQYFLADLELQGPDCIHPTTKILKTITKNECTIQSPQTRGSSSTQFAAVTPFLYILCDISSVVYHLYMLSSLNSISAEEFSLA